MDNTPIFVKIDEYKEILDVVGAINERLDKVKSLLGELKEVKKEEEAQIAHWNDQLDKVTHKMEYINSTLREM